MKHLPSLLVIALLVCLQLATTLPVSACSGVVHQVQVPPQEHVDDASLVLVGTVTDSSGDDPYTMEYTIQVESYLKGGGPDVVVITGYGTGMVDCQSDIAVGERWIFYLDGDPKSDEVLQASYVQVQDATLGASDGNITFNSKLTGQNPTAPYSTPLWTLIKYCTYSPVFKVATLVGIPGLVLAIGMRRRRPTKKKNG